uniref:DUF7795 domain-containing protein n=1 Tax=Oryza punctata TaxID=4537 RepID=A0A0E0LJ65_ORYPU
MADSRPGYSALGSEAGPGLSILVEGASIHRTEAAHRSLSLDGEDSRNPRGTSLRGFRATSATPERKHDSEDPGAKNVHPTPFCKRGKHPFNHNTRGALAMANEEATMSPELSVEDKAHRVFLDFMAKVAQYDELVDAGKRVLMKFHQELEHFRRPKLLTESGAISEIVKSNHNDRMKSYLEAGCTHHSENIQNMNKLHSCQEKLNDHISKAKLLLEELQFLEEDVYSTTLTACLSSLRHTDDCPDGDSLTNIYSEDEQQSGDLLDKAVSCASVMVLVHNMLKLDYTMQEKIVKALCIKTSSSELEGYCQMWDLRPYIDDNVMQLAWQFVP